MNDHQGRSWTLNIGDCRDVLAQMPEESVHCCVTSPPYFGLRDYGVEGQIGNEPTPDDFVEALLATFGGADNPVGVWRVLRDDGTLWLNLGDSYTGNSSTGGAGKSTAYHTRRLPSKITPGLKSKDLIGIPWRVAFALQSAGWYLRQDIIWAKPNPMPESCRDRCCKAHEYIFLMTKKPRYFYDLEAVKEPASGTAHSRGDGVNPKAASIDPGNHLGRPKQNASFSAAVAPLVAPLVDSRNLRSVWSIPTQAYSGAHFATFPEAIPARCILAGTSSRGCCPVCLAPWRRIVERDRQATRPGRDNCSDDTGKANRDERRHVTTSATVGWLPDCDCGEGDVPCTVLDPFNGSGTTGKVAVELGRQYVGIELNPEYAEMAVVRITDTKKHAPKGHKTHRPAAGQLELFMGGGQG